MRYNKIIHKEKWKRMPCWVVTRSYIDTNKFIMRSWVLVRPHVFSNYHRERLFVSWRTREPGSWRCAKSCCWFLIIQNQIAIMVHVGQCNEQSSLTPGCLMEGSLPRLLTGLLYRYLRGSFWYDITLLTHCAFYTPTYNVKPRARRKTLKEFSNEPMSSCSEAAVMLEKLQQRPCSQSSSVQFSRNHTVNQRLGWKASQQALPLRSLPTVSSLSDANRHTKAADGCDCNQFEKHMDKQSFLLTRGACRFLYFCEFPFRIDLNSAMMPVCFKFNPWEEVLT